MNQSFFEASSPGRLDVMGGIADYSGSLVLQMPLRESTTVRVALRDDFNCVLKSKTSAGEVLSATIDYRSVLENGNVSYDYARQQFKGDPQTSWAAYVVGCALVLQKEKGVDFRGADFEIVSEVPLGKGVSSSASLEVATMKALAIAFGIPFTGTELPILAQGVENRIVGAPCGLMDQLASYFGVPNKLVPILCQPDRVQPLLDIPDNIFFFGIDCGVRHSVEGASYGEVRCAAFMGYTIIAKSLGVGDEDLHRTVDGKNLSSLPYGGYLCNISVNHFEKDFRQILPETMRGSEFISEYHLTIDQATKISVNTCYAIRQCASHPVYEHERVNRFRQGLMQINSQTRRNGDDVLKSLGELMYQSHESYSRCGLGSQRTDEIVSQAKTSYNNGILGAKITGGGSGGTVCVMAHGDVGKKTVRELHQQFCEKYNEKLALFEP